MAQKYTKCEIKYSRKRNCYVMSLEFEDGKWKGAQAGAEIHQVNGYLVQMDWGFRKPMEVYKSMEEMISILRQTYGVEPIVIYTGV